MPKKKPTKIVRKPVEEMVSEQALKKAVPSGSLLRARQHKVLVLHSQGKTPDQIASIMNMRVGEVTRDVDSAIDRLIRHYAASPQHTFIRYATFQFDVIRKLQQLIERFTKDSKSVQYNAAVSALKAQSDTYDKVLEKGLTFGLIQRKQVSSAINKEHADIRSELRQEISTLSHLLDEMDGQDSPRTRPSSAGQPTITYAVIIRKPLRNAFGIVRAIPDWKYRRRVTKMLPDGTKIEVPPSRLSPEDRALLPDQDPPSSLQRLAHALLEEEKQQPSSVHAHYAQEHPKEGIPPSQPQVPPSPPPSLPPAPSTHLIAPSRS